MIQSRPMIRGLLLDWAGTTVDHGSRAPARVFLEVFQRSGVPVNEAVLGSSPSAALCDRRVIL